MEEYKNCTHKTACKVRVHISTEDEWPFVIIDGTHNHGVGGAYKHLSAKKDIPQSLLGFIQLCTSSPVDIQAKDLHQLTIEYAHDNNLNEDVVPDVRQLKKLLEKSAASDEELLENIHKFLKKEKFLVFFRYSKKLDGNEEPDYTLSCISSVEVPYVEEKEHVLVVKSTSCFQVLPKSSLDDTKAHEALCRQRDNQQHLMHMIMTAWAGKCAMKRDKKGHNKVMMNA